MPSSSSSSTNDHLPPPQKAAASKRKAGRKKFQETRHPIYKGVRQRNGKWVSELRRPKKKSSFWVGTFGSPKMAAVAYDVVALAIKGESAALNFPELSHSFPRVTSSSSINDIRTMAVETAEAFTSSNISTALPSPPSSCSSLMSEEKMVHKVVLLDRSVLDEEEVFNMPAIIAGMAEGLILTPPGMKRGFNWDGYENTIDLSLWTEE